MSSIMTMKECLIHTTLFELGAVIVGSMLAVKFSTANPNLAVGAMVGLVSIATVWNFLFNIGFDKVFTAPQEMRSIGVRVLNAIIFKLGLMLTTVPVMMILFELSLWQAMGVDDRWYYDLCFNV